MAALEDQAATEDKAAVLLGGVDSALVAAGLCRLGKQVETFSFDYTDGKYNQPHTDTVAKHLGITHNWIPVTGEMIATGLENFRNEFNAPTNWPNYVIQTKVVCEEIRQRRYYYCYSGDGCDTIFLGYPGTHRRTSLLTRLPALPDWLVNLLLFLTAIKPLERRTGHPYRVLLNIIRSLKRKMPGTCPSDANRVVVPAFGAPTINRFGLFSDIISNTNPGKQEHFPSAEVSPVWPEHIDMTRYKRPH